MSAQSSWVGKLAISMRLASGIVIALVMVKLTVVSMSG
jgi:hypothetical protein